MAAVWRVAQIAAEASANIGLPFAIYTLASPRIGAAPALMAAAGPPVLWAIGAFVRERRLDAISILALAGIVLSLLAFIGGGGVRALQLRETLVSGLVGLVFLGSVAIGRPLIHGLARAGARRQAAEASATVEAVGDDPRFRRAMTIATLSWGLGLTVACAVNCALVFVLPIRLFLLAGPTISYGAIGVLTAWTFWSVPRAVKAAAARQAGQ